MYDVYNKEAIIKKMAENCSITQVDAREEFEDVFTTLSTIIKDGNGFSIPQFAKFDVADVGERAGHNMATGEPMTIPAHKAIKVKVSQVLKDAVKGL